MRDDAGPCPSRRRLRRVVSGLRRRHGSALACALGGGSLVRLWRAAARRRPLGRDDGRPSLGRCGGRPHHAVGARALPPSSGPSAAHLRDGRRRRGSRPDGDGTAEHRIGPCRRHRSGRRRAPVVDLRTGDRATRRAVAWASLAWALAGILGATAGFLSESTGAAGFDVLGPAVLLAAGAAGPVGMAVGVTRPEVVDVRGVVTGVVVVATVLVLYVAVAVGVLAVAEIALGAPPKPIAVILVAGVLAFGVRPVQILLRGVVDRLLFGDRPDPLTASSLIADGVGDTRASLCARSARRSPFRMPRSPWTARRWLRREPDSPTFARCRCTSNPARPGRSPWGCGPATCASRGTTRRSSASWRRCWR